MDRKLISFNEKAYSAALKHAETDLSVYNSLLDKINPLLTELGVTLNKQVLLDLLKNPKEYAFDAVMENKPLTIGGAPIAKSKAIDLIEMPKAWVEIIDLVDVFNSELSANPVHKNQLSNESPVSRIGLEDFDFTDNSFVLRPEFVVELRESNSQYTMNDNENQILTHVASINDSLEGLSKLGITILPHHQLQDVGFTMGLGGRTSVVDPAVMINKIRRN